MNIKTLLKIIWEYMLKYYLLTVSILAGCGVKIIIDGIEYQRGIGVLRSQWLFDSLIIGIGSAILILAYLIYKQSTR